MSECFSLAFGIGTQNSAGEWLEVFYPQPLLNPGNALIDVIIHDLEGGIRPIKVLYTARRLGKCHFDICFDFQNNFFLLNPFAIAFLGFGFSFFIFRVRGLELQCSREAERINSKGEHDVKEIKMLREANMSIKAISLKLQISESQVSKIISGKSR